MSNLFKLKEWIDVGDAAKRLSALFEEDVTGADVLRIALDGHLKLSIHFVNEAKAKFGKIVSWQDTEWALFPNVLDTTDTKWEDRILAERAEALPSQLISLLKDHGLDQIPVDGDIRPALISLRLDDDRFITLETEVKTIKGIWDLPMLGGEKFDIENAYQSVTEGPEVTLWHPAGAFVESRDGQICQLQQWLDDDENHPGSRAQLRLIKQRIADGHIEKEEELSLLIKYNEDRAKYLKLRKILEAYDEDADFQRLFALPNDAKIVVRTEALLEFEAQHVKKVDKPESTRKTENLLRALVCMAEDAYGYDPESLKSTAPQDISDYMQKRGHSIDAKTIRAWLKEGTLLLPPRTHKD